MYSISAYVAYDMKQHDLFTLCRQMVLFCFFFFLISNKIIYKKKKKSHPSIKEIYWGKQSVTKIA